MYLVLLIKPSLHQFFPAFLFYMIWLLQICLLHCEIFNFGPILLFKPISELPNTNLQHISAHILSHLIIFVHSKLSLQNSDALISRFLDS